MQSTHIWTVRLVAGVLTATLISGDLALADSNSNKQERLARQVIEVLMADRDALVEIALSNGTTHRGRLEALGEHSFLLVDGSGQMRQVPYRQVRQAGNMSTGKILAMAGVAAGVAVMIWCAKIVGNPLCIPGE